MKIKNLFVGMIVVFALLMTSCENGKMAGASENVTEKIIIGNIITMDENNPRAEAVAIRDGVIVSVGSKSEVKKSVSKSAKVLNYRGRTVYPGFLESHTHGMLAGQRAIGQARLFEIQPTDYDKYAEVIKKFIEDNPDKEVYVAAGWSEDGTPVDYRYLDNILNDKPLILNTDGGHSALLNTKAMEMFGIDDAAVKKYGTDLVRVGADGHPNGYICEEPAIELLGKLPATLSDIKEYLLAWQEIALSEGVTAVADAGVELLTDVALQAYKELQEEGKLVLRTNAFLMVNDNEPDPAGKIKDVVKKAESLNGEYFKVVGVKAFLDGVIEAHTGWLLEDYSDAPGYHGIERFNDTDKMTKLIVEAQKHGLSVHVHSIGDGAARFMLDCIKKAEEITGDKDQRNMMAHLQLVADEEIKLMADTNTIAIVAPLWTPFFPDETVQERVYIGRERSDNTYPIKSFVDAGAKIAFHSDYPISPNINIPIAIFIAETRGYSESGMEEFESTRRNTKEAINRQQSLEAVTTNVAYAWHQEDRMGSIAPGKLANFTVADKDFLKCDIMDLPDAKIMATIIDGEIVYKAK